MADLMPPRMVLCPTCGNKRCPHATDPAYACTGSNEPGQAGSAYAATTPAQAAPQEPVQRLTDEQEAFEAWLTDDSTLPVWRDAHGYTDMTTALMWHAWRAATVAPAQAAPQEPVAMNNGDPECARILHANLTSLYVCDAPAAPARAEPNDAKCDWHSDDGAWHSACGVAYCFTDAGPVENGHRYCHACGKPLSVRGAK